MPRNLEVEVQVAETLPGGLGWPKAAHLATTHPGGLHAQALNIQGAELQVAPRVVVARGCLQAGQRNMAAAVVHFGPHRCLVHRGDTQCLTHGHKDTHDVMTRLGYHLGLGHRSKRMLVHLHLVDMDTLHRKAQAGGLK